MDHQSFGPNRTPAIGFSSDIKMIECFGCNKMTTEGFGHNRTLTEGFSCAISENGS